MMFSGSSWCQENKSTEDTFPGTDEQGSENQRRVGPLKNGKMGK